MRSFRGFRDVKRCAVVVRQGKVADESSYNRKENSVIRGKEGGRKGVQKKPLSWNRLKLSG